MRYIVVLVLMLFGSVTSAIAQVSIGIGLPGVSIGINLPVYPQLVQVPGYPVYYAPNLNSNFFFYDGMYWVYQGDNWYASTWYNGPWGLVGPQAVPLFVLRIPVGYYRAPPPYFRGWQGNAPPRWGEHWGNDWERQRQGWDKWDHHAVPTRAPLPTYQRQYSGDRYPHQVEQQQALRNQNYRYQPRDPEVQQHYQAQPAHSAPAPAQQGRAAASQERGAKPQEVQRASLQAAPQQRAPTAQGQMQQQPRQGSAQHEQQAPSQKEMQQGKGAPQESKQRGQGQERDANKGEGHNKQ